MNLLDILIVVPAIWFAYQGFRKGFIFELASLAGLVLGIYAGIHFSDEFAIWLERLFHINERYLPVVSFAILFILVVLLVYLAGRILEGMVNLLAAGFLNKLAGILFGTVKGLIMISVVFLIINTFNPKIIPEERKQGSWLYSPVSGIAPFLWNSIRILSPDSRPAPGVADASWMY
ncbi:MAG: CvpA family protein [Bacteroidales bacterium]|nr:CvpA family protein [Bacteroidales bacterium]